MSDSDLRALERLAEDGSEADRQRAAVARFRLSGDCRTGECGNSPACRSCWERAIRDQACSALAVELGYRFSAKIEDFARGRTKWRTDRLHQPGGFLKPARARMIRRCRRAVLCLNRLGIGWFKLERRGRRRTITFEPGPSPDGLLVDKIIDAWDEVVYAYSEPTRKGE
jgi:hypothetical protein